MNQFKHAKWWRSYLDKPTKEEKQRKAKKSKEKQRKAKEKQREARRKTEDSSCSLLWHFLSTSRSPFFTCYISFQSSRSQESNASNRVRFGAETRKLWLSEENCFRCAKISHTSWMVCEFRTPPSGVRNSHTPPLFADSTRDLLF